MSNIEWTGDSWNPIVGCSLKSPGCTNCYAMPMAHRLQAMAPRPDGTGNLSLSHYMGIVELSPGGKPVWTGKLAFSETALRKPLKRKKPQTYFVNSMGDLFHEDIPDEWIDKVFAVMALCPQHTFQILTKRNGRMREYCSTIQREGRWLAMEEVALDLGFEPREAHDFGFDWISNHQFLPNVWLGVSVEDKRRANERIPDLLQTPAAVRWISAEPLLAEVDLRRIPTMRWRRAEYIDPMNGRAFGMFGEDAGSIPSLDWVVCGGESGPKARPFEEQWMRSLLKQCRDAGVPFFAKQMGGAVKAQLPPIPDDLMVREFPQPVSMGAAA